MNEFINTLLNQDMEWGIIGVMILMSFVVGFFHSMILGEILNRELKARFFVLGYPALIILFALLRVNYGAIVFLILFLLVFVLGIFLMVVSIFRWAIEQVKYREQSAKKPWPFWKKALSVFFSVAFIILSIFGLPYLILFLLIGLPFIASLKTSNKKRFFRFQHNLPTSNIRSVAMGLAEISGKVEGIELLKSRIQSKNCVGYLYTIEDITTDDEGRDSYSLAHIEVQCKDFILKDHTGSIKVLSDELEFINFDIDEQYESGRKRYTQYLLTEGLEVLMIGGAATDENNEPVFKLEPVKNTFGISPVQSVQTYNDLRPLMKSAAVYAYIFAVLTALIFMTPVRISGNRLEFGKIEFFNTQKKKKPVEEVNVEELKSEFELPAESDQYWNESDIED